MALEDYKKVVKIMNRDSITGDLTYELIYIKNDGFDGETPKKIYNNISKVDRIPATGDKIYFLNDVVIPRFKIKSFCEETGSRVVKYLSSANYVIIGKRTIEKMFTTAYSSTIDRDKCLAFIDELIKDRVDYVPEWLTDLKQLIIDCNEDVILNYRYGLREWFKNQANIPVEYSKYMSEISCDDHSRLIEIMELTCDIVEEDVILKALNKNTVMDKEIFESIQKLFESVDTENVKIAMELMANCDYSKSAVYLLLLLKKYSTKIYKSPTKNHVNFKGMLNYFDLSVNRISGLSTDDAISIIIDKKLLFKSNLQVLKDALLNELCTSTNYRITDITFIDDNEEDVEIIDDTITCELPTEGSVEPVEIDPIVYEELSEVAIRSEDPLLYSKIMNVRSLIDSPEALLPIIKQLDHIGAYEHATLLTQSYLSLP
jgi:hypothetical protein